MLKEAALIVELTPEQLEMVIGGAAGGGGGRGKSTGGGGSSKGMGGDRPSKSNPRESRKTSGFDGDGARDSFTKCMANSAFDPWDGANSAVCAADAVRDGFRGGGRSK